MSLQELLIVAGEHGPFVLIVAMLLRANYQKDKIIGRMAERALGFAEVAKAAIEEKS